MIQIENEQPINVITPDGGELTVNLGNMVTTNQALTISIIPSPLNSDLTSDILVINLFDEFGTEINSFSSTVELCFSATSSTKDSCLNFYDEAKQKWVCTDPCLEKKGNVLWFVVFFSIF